LLKHSFRVADAIDGMSRSNASLAKATRARSRAGASPRRSRDQLRRLGQALDQRAADVLERVAEHGEHDGLARDAPVREGLERICTIATVAVVRSMALTDDEFDADADQQAWEVFGHLAAHRAVPLNELTKRCLRWRDAVEQTLHECFVDLALAQATLVQALAITRSVTDVTLVRMCEEFEAERTRTEEELTRRQEELVFMATHDQLTGLPNRTLILDRGEQMLSRSRRRQTPAGALLVNIDNFTAINDTLGHAAGDELLRGIAARLDGVVRETDALGRVGGDEFVVLAEELSLAAGAELIAERLQEALKAPFKLATHGDKPLTITASIGIAMGERGSAADFLRDADIALHRAKWEGKNRHVVFEAGMQDAVQARMELEMDLRRALERKELFLVYQPTFALQSMTLTGVEALIRWRHPLRGVVQPNDFIPLLEETGLIVEAGRWVLEEAARQGAAWRSAGHAISVAVNVSARQLDSDQFIAEVRGALTRSGLDADALTLEITETALMRNAEETARRLHAIKALGVRIAIDDFGTGYSSFAHLRQFPVDALKIDRSFISRLAENPEGETLIHTLVQLGKALAIETLAEGIEQAHELSVLQEEQCDSGQGFLFARPLELDQAEAFLRDWQGTEDPANVRRAGAVARARRPRARGRSVA
jgi:diguanylate cyclase (GGDEF)-like protein